MCLHRYAMTHLLFILLLLLIIIIFIFIIIIATIPENAKKVCSRSITKFLNNTSQFLTPHKYEMDATRPDQPLVDEQHKDYKDSVTS